MSMHFSMRLFFSSLLVGLLATGCAPDSTAGGSGGESGAGGTAGTTGTGGGAAGSTGAGGTAGATGAGGGAAGAGGAAGTTSSGLPPAPGAGNVPKPSGTAGNLRVLNWAGFKAAVTYTFDDGNSSQITNYDTLNALKVHYTFYLVTSWGGASNAIWKQAILDGHEIGNHTSTHQQTGTGSDVDAATTWIQQHLNVTPYTMAAPYGDSSYVTLASSRFLINRGVNNGLVGPNDSTDPFNVFCYIPPQGAAASAFNAEVDAARSAGKWKIVLVHGFTGDSSAYQPVDVAQFTAGVTYAKGLGDVWIDSMVNVGSYWRAQKMLSGVTPTTSGTTKTWTWTLPAHFPPGKFLRVTVDGGTLSQKGTPLPWDSHGYYEVALDAGSLTLAP